MPRKTEYERRKKRMAEDPAYANKIRKQKAAQHARRRSKGKIKKTTPEQHRKARLKRYGWTPEAVDNAKVTQNYRCAICNEIKVLVADHEHSDPPKPRQLLCDECNKGLGCFRDEPKLLEWAGTYLRKWGKS